MSRNAMPTSRVNRVGRSRAGALAVTGMLACVCFVSAGCHDGPLYGLKRINPYFTMREWKRDRDLGVTDHERHQQMQLLAKKIGTMSSKDQVFWSTHLKKILDNDPSPEMRRLAVVAASNIKSADAIAMIEQGLDDASMKVQMESCRSLGKRPEPQATQLLAATLGTTGEQDVRNSAIEALGKHKGTVAVDSLRLVLEDQNPATVDLAMSSLRGVMGKDYGNDPTQWIAAIDALPKTPTPSGDPGVRYAERESGSTIR